MFVLFVGLDSSVGIVTRNGLGGPGIESCWGEDIPCLSEPALGPPSPLYNGYRVFPGDKAAGRGVKQPPARAEVNERVEL